MWYLAFNLKMDLTGIWIAKIIMELIIVVAYFALSHFARFDIIIAESRLLMADEKIQTTKKSG
jgi:hypothetical protein